MVLVPWTPPPWGWIDQPQHQTKAHQEQAFKETYRCWKFRVSGSTEYCTTLQWSKTTAHSENQPWRPPSQLSWIILESREVWDLHQCVATCLQIYKIESNGKMPSKSKPDFPQMGKIVGLSCLQCLTQLRLYLLCVFLTCSPPRGCRSLYMCMCWWLFARAFWCRQQRLSIQCLLDIALCSGELLCFLVSLAAIAVPLHSALSTI